MNTQNKETLTFQRMATKQKDGKNGVLYVHAWNTGFQQLVFDDHEAAKRFEDKLNTPEHIEHLRQPA